MKLAGTVAQQSGSSYRETMPEKIGDALRRYIVMMNMRNTLAHYLMESLETHFPVCSEFIPEFVGHLRGIPLNCSESHDCEFRSFQQGRCDELGSMITVPEVCASGVFESVRNDHFTARRAHERHLKHPATFARSDGCRAL